MKETNFTKAASKVIEIKLAVIDRFIEEYIEPMADIGSPEKLIGKKYEEWTPQDIQQLGQIYGTGNDTSLAKIIFKRKYEALKMLEQEVE